MRRCVGLIVLLLAAPALADVVVLKDGRRLEGEIRAVPGGWRIVDASGASVTVPTELVKTIESTGYEDPQRKATVALAAVRRFAESSANIDAIIERLEKFIADHTGAEAAAEATRELPVWQSRKADGLVKVGAQWVTKEQQLEMNKKLVAMLDQARNLVREGRLREADTLIGELLAFDASNASANYLRGVSLFMQDKVGESRQAFEQVRTAMPDHGPTLNNLAVINFRQRQHLGGLALYAMAMSSSPGNKQILDNVAEALHAVPAKDREAKQVSKALALFAEQDTALQKKRAAQRLYRWGGTWIDETAAAENRRAEQQVKARLDQLRAEYEKIRTRIGTIEVEVDTNRRHIEQLEASR